MSGKTAKEISNMSEKISKDKLSGVAGGGTQRPAGMCTKYHCDECHGDANCLAVKDGKDVISVNHKPGCSRGGSYASCQTCSYRAETPGDCVIDWY